MEQKLWPKFTVDLINSELRCELKLEVQSETQTKRINFVCLTYCERNLCSPPAEGPLQDEKRRRRHACSQHFILRLFAHIDNSTPTRLQQQQQPQRTALICVNCHQRENQRDTKGEEDEEQGNVTSKAGAQKKAQRETWKRETHRPGCWRQR